MSNKSDIIDGKLAHSSSRGLAYTCRCGWIDLGHARADGAAELWNRILNENGNISRDKKGYKINYRQPMTQYGITKYYSRDYYVQLGLNKGRKESVALSIFMEVSHGFENLQSNFFFANFTDSGYSAEDLISNLIGFYRAVRPGYDYIKECQPVSKTESTRIWDTYGAVGKNKNYSFTPFVYPCIECNGGPSRATVGKLPDILTSVTPEKKGEIFRDWNIWLD